MLSKRWMLVSGTFGLALLGALTPSCDSSTGERNNPKTDGGPSGSEGGGPPVVGVDEAGAPIGQPVVVDPDAQNPKDDTGKPLNWQPADLLKDVTAIVSRDSAIISVPAI